MFEELITELSTSLDLYWSIYSTFWMSQYLLHYSQNCTLWYMSILSIFSKCKMDKPSI